MVVLKSFQLLVCGKGNPWSSSRYISVWIKVEEQLSNQHGISE